MRNRKIPEGAEIIRTYREYERLVQAFFEGAYQLLIVLGRPGLAKSHAFETRLGPLSHLVKGWAAPLQAYIDCYKNRGKLLVFDDAESLWKCPGGRILLRSLCELKPRKLIQWSSTTPALAKAGVPQSFTTSSRVAIIANRASFGGAEEYEAVMDRGHLVFFDPTPAEVHRQVGDWFWDQDVYNFIGERLHLLDDVSARLYLKASERKKAGGDWQKLIEEAYCRDRATMIVLALEVDPSCRTVEERATKFIEQTGASRGTYFNLKRTLREGNELHPSRQQSPPPRRLRGQPPEELDIEDEIAKARQEDEEGGSTQGSSQGDDDSTRESIEAECESPEGLDHENGADWWKRPHPSEARSEGGDGDRGIPCRDATARLRRQLKNALDREDYERAADLRDEIRSIEEDRRRE